MNLSLARSGCLAAALVGAWLLASPTTAHAQGMCRVVNVDMTPSSDLQIVMWLEDEAGNYVDTLFITRLTGTYGLGNRPGMMDFNSAWRWPYGRRVNTFPIWAHRHGYEFPYVIFQNEDDRNLSHPLSESSREEFYCRPLREGEAMWDSQTCASTVYTDKGKFSDIQVSLYPPRSDIAYDPDTDDPVVAQYTTMNVFDAVSRPTPPGDEPYNLSWPIPPALPPGNYTLWVEVNREFDQNPNYTYTEPVGIPWGDYGVQSRGQPSVVYRVPFSITEGENVALASDYYGYGDPEGLDGEIREPDPTITTGVEGSGASRLLLNADADSMYRVRVTARATADGVAPAAPTEIEALNITQDQFLMRFVAPSDDDGSQMVSGYDVRYMVGKPITEANFDEARQAAVTIAPDEPGIMQTAMIGELLPRTNYYFGVRAYDECGNPGKLAVVQVTTPEREIGEVPWCFVATAAYGSVMAADVTMLRWFRDRFLRTHVTGELLVESYYTFGPALAKMIEPSDTMRRAARAGLAPIVEAVRDLSNKTRK